MSATLWIGSAIIGWSILWLTVVLLDRRSRAESFMMMKEVAKQIVTMTEILDDIAEIPAVLQDLNLGGVELRPQKSILELGFEWLTNRNSPEGVNSTPHLPDPWPHADAKPEQDAAELLP